MPPRKKTTAPTMVADAPVPTSMKVAELREELGRRGLETTGVKADLVGRLTDAMVANSQPAAKKAKVGTKAASAAVADDEEERPAKKSKAPPKAKAKPAAVEKGANKAAADNDTEEEEEGGGENTSKKTDPASNVKPVNNGPFKDKTFVFTGELAHLTRAKATSLLERCRGRAVGSVSGLVDFVVVGKDFGEKRAEALKRGIELLDEDEFLAGAQGGLKVSHPAAAAAAAAAGAQEEEGGGDPNGFNCFAAAVAADPAEDFEDRVVSATTAPPPAHTAPLAHLKSDSVKSVQLHSCFTPKGCPGWLNRTDFSYGSSQQHGSGGQASFLEVDGLPAKVRLFKLGLDGKEKFLELELWRQVNMWNHSNPIAFVLTTKLGRTAAGGTAAAAAATEGSFGGNLSSSFCSFSSSETFHDSYGTKHVEAFKAAFTKHTGHAWSEATSYGGGPRSNLKHHLFPSTKGGSSGGGRIGGGRGSGGGSPITASDMLASSKLQISALKPAAAGGGGSSSASYWTAVIQYERQEERVETMEECAPGAKWVTITGNQSPPRSLSEVQWAAKTYPEEARIQAEVAGFACGILNQLVDPVAAAEAAAAAAASTTTAFPSFLATTNQQDGLFGKAKAALELLQPSLANLNNAGALGNKARAQAVAAVSSVVQCDKCGLGSGAPKAHQLAVLKWGYTAMASFPSLQALVVPKLQALFAATASGGEKEGGGERGLAPPPHTPLDPALIRGLVAVLRPEDKALCEAATSLLSSNASLAKQLEQDVGKTLAAMAHPDALADAPLQATLFKAFAEWDPEQQRSALGGGWGGLRGFGVVDDDDRKKMAVHALKATAAALQAATDVAGLQDQGRQETQEKLNAAADAAEAAVATSTRYSMARQQLEQGANQARSAALAHGLLFLSSSAGGKEATEEMDGEPSSNPLADPLCALLRHQTFAKNLTFLPPVSSALLKWLVARHKQGKGKRKEPEEEEKGLVELVSRLLAGLWQGPKGFRNGGEDSVLQTLSETLPLFPNVQCPPWFSTFLGEPPVEAPIGTVVLQVPNNSGGGEEEEGGGGGGGGGGAAAAGGEEKFHFYLGPTEHGPQCGAVPSQSFNRPLEVFEVSGEAFFLCSVQSSYGTSKKWVYAMASGENHATFTPAAEVVEAPKKKVPKGCIESFGTFISAHAAAAAAATNESIPSEDSSLGRALALTLRAVSSLAANSSSCEPTADFCVASEFSSAVAASLSAVDGDVLLLKEGLVECLIPAIHGLVDAKPLEGAVAALLPLLTPKPSQDEAVEEVEDKAATKKKKEQAAQVETRQKELGEVLAAIARRANPADDGAATNAAPFLVLLSPHAPALESLYEKMETVGHSAGSNVGEALWAAAKEAEAATGTPPDTGTLAALCLGNLNSTETRLGVVTALLNSATAAGALLDVVTGALSEASSELLKSKECAPRYLTLLQAHLPAVKALLLNAAAAAAAAGAADDDESTKKAGEATVIAFGAKLFSAVHRHRKEERATRSAGLSVLVALFSQHGDSSSSSSSSGSKPPPVLLLPATAATVTQLAETAAVASSEEGAISSVVEAGFLLSMAEALTAGGALKASLTKKVLLCALDALKHCPDSPLVAASVAALVARAPAKELKSKDVGARKGELEDALTRFPDDESIQAAISAFGGKKFGGKK